MGGPRGRQGIRRGSWGSLVMSHALLFRGSEYKDVFSAYPESGIVCGGSQ